MPKFRCIQNVYLKRKGLGEASCANNELSEAPSHLKQKRLEGFLRNHGIWFGKGLQEHVGPGPLPPEGISGLLFNVFNPSFAKQKQRLRSFGDG